jgi:hypothetical protein
VDPIFVLEETEGNHFANPILVPEKEKTRREKQSEVNRSVMRIDRFLRSRPRDDERKNHDFFRKEEEEEEKT